MKIVYTFAGFFLILFGLAYAFSFLFSDAPNAGPDKLQQAFFVQMMGLGVLSLYFGMKPPAFSDRRTRAIFLAVFFSLIALNPILAMSTCLGSSNVSCSNQL